MADRVLVPVDSCVRCPMIYSCKHCTYGVTDKIPDSCPYRRQTWLVDWHPVKIRRRFMIGRVFVRSSDGSAWVCVAKLSDIVILKKSGTEHEYEKI